MNWFKGSIAEAVTLSKQKNATFVVYVEGKDENSVKLTGFLNQPEIKQKLEDDNFVAIKIEGGSESYMQFARIYQIVPLPSLFFIGKNGTPLEIATGICASSEELESKIDNVLKLTGKVSNTSSAASASAAFIAGEQKKEVAASTPTTSAGAKKEQISQDDLSSISDLRSITESKPVEDTTSSKSSLSSIELPTSSDAPESSAVSPPNDLYCTDTTCFRKPNNAVSSHDIVDPPSDNTSSLAESISMDTVPAPSETAPTTPPNDVADTTPVKASTPDPTPSTPVSTPTTASSPPARGPLEENPAAAIDKLEQAKQLIEERRKLKQAEEERQARERELNRRKDGKASQGVQKWQKEQDFKELKESIRRDKMEDQAARQRILEQIASDRAERANKFTPPSPNPTPQATTPTTVNPPSNLEMSRIQFRIPNGETSTQTFESSDTFATVRAYVKVVVVKGTGIKDFTLATTFPKHEFTEEDDKRTLLELGLAPSAVILIIGKASSGPSAVVARSGGIVNIFNTVFWALMTPVLSVFGYIRNFIIGRNDGGADGPRPATTGAQKRANEERIDANDLAKKRNLDRFLLTKDGPSTSKEAMATANSTGGAYRRVGGSNIHRLSDQRKDSDDENNTWNGNSTQQQ
ncbi:UBX domain-containing protein 4 [Episyrphus balteatus]|uniref:UBX domain-containing protein 4 n=1 Tax=Episyrphus balteatus TaxID=286459 RepID=UPI0024857CA5|nr:UBX domain-containing protein 4 [Episyrphus balteatus]